MLLSHDIIESSKTSENSYTKSSFDRTSAIFIRQLVRSIQEKKKKKKKRHRDEDRLRYVALPVFPRG